MSPDLHEALTARTRQADTSKADVVLDLIEQSVRNGTLADLIAQDDRDRSTAEGLFPRLESRKRAQPAIPTEIRLAPDALAILDELVVAHQAKNRTQLLTAVIADGLGTHE